MTQRPNNAGSFSTAEILPGIVRSFAGTSPGPASGLTYTIDAYFPRAGLVTLAGQTPACERRPDTVDVTAVAIGTGVLGILFDGQIIQWMFRELDAYAECPTGAGAGGIAEMLRSAIERQLEEEGGPIRGTPGSGGTDRVPIPEVPD